MDKIIIWGSSGNALVLEEFLNAHYELVSIFDNNVNVLSPIESIPIYYGIKGLEDWIKLNKLSDESIRFVVAIGGAYGFDRYAITKILEDKGFVGITAKHPTSYIARNCEIGENCQFMAHSFLGAKAVIGDSCILNTRASVDHESILGNGVHIGPGAVLCGLVQVDDFSFIGAGATVLPRIKIGKNCIIGAGAIVTKDIMDNEIVIGNPARFSKNNPQISNSDIF